MSHNIQIATTNSTTPTNTVGPAHVGPQCGIQEIKAEDERQSLNFMKKGNTSRKRKTRKPNKASKPSRRIEIGDQEDPTHDHYDGEKLVPCFGG